MPLSSLKKMFKISLACLLLPLIAPHTKAMETFQEASHTIMFLPELWEKILTNTETTQQQEDKETAPQENLTLTLRDFFNFSQACHSFNRIAQESHFGYYYHKIKGKNFYPLGSPLSHLIFLKAEALHSTYFVWKNFTCEYRITNGTAEYDEEKTQQIISSHYKEKVINNKLENLFEEMINLYNQSAILGNLSAMEALRKLNEDPRIPPSQNIYHYPEEWNTQYFRPLLSLSLKELEKMEDDTFLLNFSWSEYFLIFLESKDANRKLYIMDRIERLLKEHNLERVMVFVNRIRNLTHDTLPEEFSKESSEEEEQCYLSYLDLNLPQYFQEIKKKGISIGLVNFLFDSMVMCCPSDSNCPSTLEKFRYFVEQREKCLTWVENNIPKKLHFKIPALVRLRTAYYLIKELEELLPQSFIKNLVTKNIVFIEKLFASIPHAFNLLIAECPSFTLYYHDHAFQNILDNKISNELIIPSSKLITVYLREIRNSYFADHPSLCYLETWNINARNYYYMGDTHSGPNLINIQHWRRVRQGVQILQAAPQGYTYVEFLPLLYGYGFLDDYVPDIFAPSIFVTKTTRDFLLQHKDEHKNILLAYLEKESEVGSYNMIYHIYPVLLIIAGLGENKEEFIKYFNIYKDLITQSLLEKNPIPFTWGMNYLQPYLIEFKMTEEWEGFVAQYNLR